MPGKINRYSAAYLRFGSDPPQKRMPESGARLVCSLILSPDPASGFWSRWWKNVEIRSRAALSPDSVSAISVAPISQTIRPKPAYCVQKPHGTAPDLGALQLSEVHRAKGLQYS